MANRASLNIRNIHGLVNIDKFDNVKQSTKNILKVK